MFIEYWETSRGDCPVLEFMEAQSPRAAAKIQWVIDYFEEQGMNLIKSNFMKKITNGIYELRVKIADMYYRVIVVVEHAKAWLIHAFAKKSKKIPPQIIKLAKERKNQILGLTT